MAYNLYSPNGILEPCNLLDLDSWFKKELNQLSNVDEKLVIQYVTDHINSFVQFPQKAILLWLGCNRTPEQGKTQKYHTYPPHIKQIANNSAIYLDTRPNGPAIASFLLSGGIRPDRFGSSNAWSIHHLYSGKYPYINKTVTLHSTKEDCHFTQSAGLIAVHPIADALVDEFPFFTWLLRAKAYLKFGYDPDNVFSNWIDEYGFSKYSKYEVIETKT